MVFYYELQNGTVLACSARGTFRLTERQWVRTSDMSYSEMETARLIDEEEVEKIRRRFSYVPADDKWLYLTSLGVRNDIISRMEGWWYLKSIPVVKQLEGGDTLEFTTPVTLIVGENGTGKSTLLEAIAVSFGFNAEGGGKNFDFESKRTHSDLYQMVVLGKNRLPKDGYFIRSESFYNLASNIDQLASEGSGILNYYGGKSLHDQSHGESYLSLVKNRLYGNGLYILDEPETALSPKRIIELMKEMKRLVNKKSQFIIVTHSPILMTYPGARIYECTKGGIKEKRYQELESYQFMRDFLLNPEYYLMQEELL